MYKFPVTKNGIEYAVKIYKDSLLEAYHIKLFKKSKIFGFTVDVKLKQGIYDISSFDTYIVDGTYFIEIATRIIEIYEKENSISSQIMNCFNEFNKWDGTI
jgi:hypothetical protein